ncbi:MAG: DUF2779 domain-containing protein, partial [Brachymonas sp.]|nr:DUF2779 domain-containing protein [Brachymonas sp.]
MQSGEPQATHSIQWLPHQGVKLIAHLETHHIIEMREAPIELLNSEQLRVKQATLTGSTFFDKKAAAAALSPHKLPAYFLDFETITSVVPRWKGTSPYQKIPFQYSLQRLSRTGRREEAGFLDLSGKDPRKEFAKRLINDCGN